MENAEDHFSLKWSNFRSSLTEGFHDFLREEMMVDVTLAAEGKFVQAHKLVLSVCSPYFKNLFKVNPCKHPIVILKDVGQNELTYMLQFMYRGEVGVKHEDLPSFLKLAETLKVKGLAGEKIQNQEGFSSNSGSKMARVRKKKKMMLELDKENTELSSPGDGKSRVTRDRKRRLSAKSESGKKVKQEKSEEERLDYNSVSVSVSGAGGGDDDDDDDDDEDDEDDDDEDDNPLAKLIVDKIRKDENSKTGESQSDLKSNSYNDGDGDAADDDDNEDEDDGVGNTDDFDISPSLFNPDNSTETEQTPQGHLSSLIISRAPRAFVWDYFLKETHQAICLNCGKTFKGQRPNTICEQHLKRRHPEFYKILLEKKIKRAELHMNPMVMGMGIPSYDHD